MVSPVAAVPRSAGELAPEPPPAPIRRGIATVAPPRRHLSSKAYVAACVAATSPRNCHLSPTPQPPTPVGVVHKSRETDMWVPHVGIVFKSENPRAGVSIAQ